MSGEEYEKHCRDRSITNRRDNLIKGIIDATLIFCIFIAMTAGCGMDGGEQPVSGASGAALERENVSGENSDSADPAENSMSGTSDTSDTETAPAAVNAWGMPLMEDTALLVTVTKYRSSDNYHEVWAQYEYDSRGNILRAVEWSGMEYSNTEYEYDGAGRLSRKTCYEAYWREELELKDRVEYAYAENGADGAIDRTERRYDREGVLQEEHFYDSRGTLLKEMYYKDDRLSGEYEYDAQENRSWRTWYDGDGNIRERRREDYDAMGTPILTAEYDGEGNLNVFEGYECDTYVTIYPYWRYENTYDNNGNLIRQVIYDYDNVQTDLREYDYDEKGRLVREFFSEEMVTESSEYVYDSAGNRIRSIYTYYEYDDTGNLAVQESYTVWEREYDGENRLVRHYRRSPDEYWYVYEYEVTGVSEEEYPYDQIRVRQFF